MQVMDAGQSARRPATPRIVKTSSNSSSQELLPSASTSATQKDQSLGRPPTRRHESLNQNVGSVPGSISPDEFPISQPGGSLATESLKDKLLRARQKSEYKERAYFLTHGDLADILNVDAVKAHFHGRRRPWTLLCCPLGSTPRYKVSEVLTITEYICGNTSSATERQPEKPAARLIFATLVLCRQTDCIFDFKALNLHDGHLPFVRCNIQGTLFDLSKRGPNLSPLESFKSWKTQKVERFEEYQWYMKPPFFKLDHGPAQDFDEGTILPWTESRDISEGTFSTVKRIAIHPAQHAFDFPSSVSKPRIGLKDLMGSSADFRHLGNTSICVNNDQRSDLV